MDVDIIAATGNATGYVVNNFQSGEWLSYTINVGQAGVYRIEALVSSEFTNSRWHAEIDGVNVTGPIAVPSTGSWDTFQWFGKDGVSLTAGQHVLRIVAEQQYFNLDAIRISRQLPTPFTGTAFAVPGLIQGNLATTAGTCAVNQRGRAPYAASA